MATTAAELLVKVGADTDAAQRKLNGMSKEFDALRAGASKMALGLTVAVAAAGAGVVAFASKAVAAGSDLAESQNKMAVVFGQSSTAIEQWASTANTAMGMTTQAAIDNAGAMGNLFSQIGIGQQKAAEMSQNLVQLSADLASFHNATGGAAEVMEAMSASFRGEYDAMQRYIPTLSAAAVEHQALAMTGKATADQLTAMDKALATQAIMLRDAGAAVGDFARTADGWANQNRILQATLANITAEIGTKLLPVLTPYLQALTDYVANTGPKVVQAFADAVITLQALNDTVKQFDYERLVNGLNETGTRATTFSEQIAGFLANLSSWGDAIFGFVGDQLRLAGEQIAAFGDLLTGKINWEEFKNRLDDVAESGGKVWEQFGGLMGEISNNVGKFDEQVAGLTAVSQANQEASDWWQRHGQALQNFNEDAAMASDALWSMADVWSQAYDAIQNTTITSLDNSRTKVLETFNGMAQDYANHAAAIVDLEDRKGQMVAYLESVYQQQAAALQAAGENAKLADLTRAHQAKLNAVLASYNTQINLEKLGQTQLLSNAKQYYVTVLQVMARSLSAQVSAVRSNMLALVRMAVSGYGSAAAAAMAFNAAAGGAKTIAKLTAAMADVTSAMQAIEGAGLDAIEAASSGFEDWQNSLDDVNNALGDTSDALAGLGSAAGSASGSVRREIIDPLEEAARVVERLGGMVEKAIEAFDTLAGWGGPSAGWQGRFAELLSMLQAAVTSYAQMVDQLDFDAETFASLQETATTLMKVAEIMEKAVKAFDAVAGWVPAHLEHSFELILAQLRDLAYRWRNAAEGFDAALWEGALWFAGIADRILSPLVKMVQSFDAVAGWVPDHLEDSFELILAQLRDLAYRWRYAAEGFDAALWQGALWFAGIADKIISPLVDMVKAFDAVAGWAPDQLEDSFELILAQLRDLAYRWRNAAEGFDADLWEAALKFAEAAKTLIAPIKGMVDAFEAIVGWTVGYIEPLLGGFFLNLRKLARMWMTAAQVFDEELLEGSLWFAEAAKTLIAPIKGMAEAFEAVVGWTVGYIEPILGGFMLNLRKLARMWMTAAQVFDQELLEGALWFAEAAKTLIAPIKDMADAFTAMMAWVEYYIEPILGGFMLNLRKLARAWTDAALAFDQELLEGALWFAEIADTLVAPLSAMVEAFEAVAQYVPQRIGPTLNALLDQLRGLASKWRWAAVYFDEEMLEGALWFADVAGRLVAPITAMVEAFEAVARYIPTYIGRTMTELLLRLQALARKWQVAARDFDQELLEGALWFADAAGRLVAPITAMTEAFTALVSWAPWLSTSLDAFMTQLRELALAWIDTAALFDKGILEGALWFADAAGRLVAPITAMTEAFAALTAWTPGSITDKLDPLFDQLASLVRGFIRISAQFSEDGLAAARLLAEAVGSVMSALSAALDLLTKIKTYVSPSANALLAFERDVEDLLVRFTRWIVFVIQPIASKIDREAMEAMQGMTNALQSALELLNGLVDFVSPTAAQMQAFMDGVDQLALDFFEWATTNGPQLFKEIPPEFLEAFRMVFEGLRAAVDVLVALVDFVPPSVIAVMQFEEGYQRLFTDWLTWAQGTFADLNTEIVTAVAAIFGQVFDGLRAAVDVLTALVGFVPPSVIAVMQFEEGYQRLFTDWVTWATGTFADLNTEIVTAVASVFGNVFQGLGAAADTLALIVDYVGPSQAAIVQFETDYQRLFTGFVAWVETTFSDVSTDLIVAMTGAASALFQGLGAAATTLTQITGYIGPTETTIVRFEQDYQRLAEGFRDWAQSSWTEETTATATAVGDAVNSLYTGLGTAATTLSLIRNYTPPSQAVIDQFIADMTNVMGTMLAWVQTSFGPEAQQIMTGFGNTTQALFTGIGTALTVLEGIAGYVVTDSEFRLALQRFNDNLLTAITSWQIWLVNTFTPETAALTQQFHTLMSGIIADMRDALQLLMDIDQASLPTADELLAFLNAVAALFDGVLAVFGNVAGGVTQLVTMMGVTIMQMLNLIDTAVSDFGPDLIDTFATMFDTLYQEIYEAGAWAGWRFLDGLRVGMDNIQRQNAIIQAMRDLADQLEAELRAAWGISSPSKVAERIGGYFVSGLERGLRDLDNIPSLIQRSLAMDSVMLGADVRYSPAPRHDYLTIQFQGTYQTGMSPAEEKRVTGAMVAELRRQGVALQVARV